MGRLNKSQFKFRKHDHIGCEGAEEDDEFLEHCFVDLGDLNVLRDTADKKRIVVGRTGSGKTALLRKLKQIEDRSVLLDPSTLALRYLANSTVIKHLEELGVKLDIFYRLLWKHILAVELIQLKYHIHSDIEQQSFLAKMHGKFFGDRKKSDALDYLVQWGKRFWNDTELRVHEVTDKLTDDISTSLGAKLTPILLSTDRSAVSSTEERKEIFHRAQEVVNGIQIQKLSQVIEVLGSDVFAESYPKYYVLIDRLDENWIDEPLKLRLIRALIETVRDFQHIRSAKVIVALRSDLAARVFRITKDAGFQQEKYQPFFLRLQWSDESLMNILDLRLNRLVQRQYTKEEISWQDILPRAVNNTPTEQYFVARTMHRPRDIIQLCNCCIVLATDKPEISAATVRQAEGVYSSQRLESLSEEWASEYPELGEVVTIIRKRQALFPASDISDDDIKALSLRLCTKKPPEGKQGDWWNLCLEEKVPCSEIRLLLLGMMYDVGVIGVRPGISAPVSWSYVERIALREAEITSDARVEISPMFFRVLGTETRA